MIEWLKKKALPSRSWLAANHIPGVRRSALRMTVKPNHNSRRVLKSEIVWVIQLSGGGKITANPQGRSGTQGVKEPS